MSYCTRTDEGSPLNAINMENLKDYLNIDPSDVTFDNQLSFYLSAAISYLEKTYNLVLSPGTFICRYNKDYFNLPKYNVSNGVEIILPKPVKEISKVRYGYRGFSTNDIKSDINYQDVSYLYDKNIITIPYNFYVFNYYSLEPYFWSCWQITDFLEVECQLGYDAGSFPLDLMLVIFQMVGEMYSKKGICDCSKICENDVNSAILMNYGNIIG